MDDLISRQAAIDAAHIDISIIPYKKAREYADATISEIRNRLKKLPSVQPEPKWIPCSERLPEEYGNYITTMNYGDVQECTYSPEKNTRFMRGGWSTCEHDGILFLDASEVIAWMPLPEPWKEGD